MALELRTVLTADTTLFRAALTNATAQMRGLFREGRVSGSGFGEVLGALGVPTGRLIGWAALGMAIHQAVVEVKELSDAAARFGASPETLDEIADAAGLVGVQFDGVQTAIIKSNTQLVKARHGSVNALAAFAKLGINVADMTGTPVENFIKMAAMMKGIGGDAEKTAAAQQILGRHGTRLIPAMDKIAATEPFKEGIGTLAIDEAKASLTTLKIAWEGFVDLMVLALGGISFLFNTLSSVVFGVAAGLKSLFTWGSLGDIWKAAGAGWDQFIGMFSDSQRVRAERHAAIKKARRDGPQGGLDIDEEEDRGGERKGIGKAIGAADPGAAVGLRIGGENIGALDLEQRRHEALMAGLAVNSLEAQREVARHVRRLANL